MSSKEFGSSSEANVCAAALPVLARQVETARSQAEHAVLVLNKHFISVMQQLQEMSALALAVHDGGSAAFDRIDEAFMQISEAQSATEAAQADIARRNGALAPELSGLLALARESGNAKLIETAESVATQLFDLMAAQESVAANSRAASRQSDQRVDAVLGPYGETLSKLAQYGDGMRGEIAECLMSLQFQDRISQILSHVTSSMDLLTQYLQRPQETEASRRFLDEMSSGYTTDEQHENHEMVQRALQGAAAK